MAMTAMLEVFDTQMTGLGANFPACRWRSAPISSRNDPAVGRRAFRRCRSGHGPDLLRPTRERLREAGLRDLRPVRLVSTRNLCRLPGGAPWLTAGEIRHELECRPRGTRRAPTEQHQFATETTRTKNQGKDHPMQHLRPTMRQEDLTQASPARSAFAHRTLSTPHARATSCGRFTGLRVR